MDYVRFSISRLKVFVQLKTDAYVYQLTMANHNIPGTFVIGVFVDDILCLGCSSSVIKWFQSVLSEMKMKIAVVKIF